MKKLFSKTLIILCLFFVILTLFSLNNVKAYTKRSVGEEVYVTYTSGNGLGEDVTIRHPILASGTRGASSGKTNRDYTDNKIIFARNGEETNIGSLKNPVKTNVLNFTHENSVDGYSYIITGWKLVSVTKKVDGVETVYTDFVEPLNQNYVNPDDVQKDIDHVYAQEGWYVVPNNVTKITVEAVYGKVIYVRSPYDTMYYDEYHLYIYGSNNVNGTTVYSDTYPNNTGEIAVEKSSDSNTGKTINDAVATLKRAYELIDADATKTVYDNVILLCGDTYEVFYKHSLPTRYNSHTSTLTQGTYQYYCNTGSNFAYNTSSKKAVTIAGLSGDEVLYLNAITHEFKVASSLRFDNVQLKPLTDAHLKDSLPTDNVTISTNTRNYRFNLSNNMTFEITETAPSSSTQFLWANNAKSVILNNGMWHLFVSWTSSNKTINDGNYFLVGGHAYFNRLCNSIGQDVVPTVDVYLTNPVTISINGGYIDGLYGSPVKEKLNIKGDAYIFMSNGYVANFFGGDQGSIYPSNTEKGNVNIVTYGGKINILYGAGQKYTSKVYGDVNIELNETTISNNVYGGGKGGAVLGNINLTINNCNIKGSIFGAGLGLTDTITHITQWSSGSGTSDFSDAIANYNSTAKKNGYPLWEEAPGCFPRYDYENSQIITRIYHSYSFSESKHNLFLNTTKVSLTLSETHGNVNLKINDSIVGQNVYGGGSISIVEGNIDVDIFGCEIKGNVYGGGDGTAPMQDATLYSPIKQENYKPLTKNDKQDPAQSLKNFKWNNNIDILNYFKGIYDGVRQVVYNEDGTTTPFSALSIEAQNIASELGAVQLIYFANTDKLGMVYKDINLTIDNAKVNGSIFGGGNKGQTLGNVSTNIINCANTFANAYAGSNQADIKGNVTLNILNGKIKNAFGANNISGTIDGQVLVNVNGGEIDYLYGGGNEADDDYLTTININAGQITTLYGGGNKASVGDVILNVKAGIITNLYGGNNESGTIDGQVLVNVNGGEIDCLYGGGNEANDDYLTTININGGQITTLYGGGKEASVGKVILNVETGSITTLFGGGDQGDTLGDVTINVTNGTIETFYSGANQANITGNVTTKINNGTIRDLFGGNNISGIIDRQVSVEINDGNITNLYGGGNEADGDYISTVTLNDGIVNVLYGGGKNADISKSIINIQGGVINTNLYGGGFKGNIVDSSIEITKGIIGNNVYGGGYAGTANTTEVLIKEENDAYGTINIGGSVFGGGEGLSASVYTSTQVYIELNIDLDVSEAVNSVAEITSGETKPIVTIKSGIYSKINKNVYGGGDLGQVGDGIINQSSNTATITKKGETQVTIKNGYIGGSVFGGGSGVPTTGNYTAEMGAVFGSTLTTINGGIIGDINTMGSTIGNVYGGGTQSRLFQSNESLLAAEVNITEDALPIVISGSIFGGGDRGDGATTNASVPTTIGDVEVNIEGKGDLSKIYFLRGGVYGDGNLCLVEGIRTINVSGFTTGDNEKLKTFYSLQRADVVNLDNSDFVLLGAIDLVEEGDLTVYSINRIKELNFNNGSTVKLDQIVKYLSKITSDYTNGNITPERVYVSHGYNGTNGYKESQYKNDVTPLTEGEEKTYLEDTSGMKNTICVANGLYLELINTNNTYGTVEGLFTLQLLRAVPGEGGGFVYASKNHYLGDFICETNYVQGGEKNMPVIDNVGGKKDGDFAYYVWYIQGNVINYTLGITGYIGSEQTSYEESTIIPTHQESLVYVLNTLEVNQTLENVLIGTDKKYTLVTKNTNLTDQEIALELRLGNETLGYLAYDGEKWGILLGDRMIKGYENNPEKLVGENRKSCVIFEDKVVSLENCDLNIILHKSVGVDAEVTGMMINKLQIDIYNSQNELYNKTSKLIYKVGFSIVRLVPEQYLYTGVGSMYAGLLSSEDVYITSGSSFTMEYQTKYIPSAFPNVDGRKMEWYLSVKGYSYYYDDLGNYLTVDSDGKCINISPTLTMDSNETGKALVNWNGSNYEYSHGGSTIIMKLDKTISKSVLPVGTKITLIDLSDDKNPSYFYYIVNTETSKINLNDFYVMGSRQKASEVESQFELQYNNNKASRVTERLVFIIDFENVKLNFEGVINNKFVGMMCLIHEYGLQNKEVDIMDYVKSEEKISGDGTINVTYDRENPVETTYTIIDNAENDGIEEINVEFDKTNYNEDEVVNLIIEVTKDLTYTNTQYEDGKLGIVIELEDGSNLPEGIEFEYNGARLPKFGNKYVVIPIKNFGKHVVQIEKVLGFNPQQSKKVSYKATLCYLPDDNFYNQTIVRVKNISAITTTMCTVNLKEPTSLKVTINDRVVSKTGRIVIDVKTLNCETNVVNMKWGNISYRIMTNSGVGMFTLDMNSLPNIQTGSYIIEFEIEGRTERINVVVIE